MEKLVFLQDSRGSPSSSVGMSLDKMSFEDVQKLYKQMEKKEVLSRYTFPDAPTSDGYYHIYVPDATKKTGRRAIKAKTLTALQDKVYQFERGIQGGIRKTFRDVFLIASDEKLRYVKDPQRKLSVLNSVARSHSAYDRFFTGTAFEQKFIDDITKRDIETEVLSILERYDLRKKAFAGLKSILNSVFSLAYQEYWIRDNPYTRINFRQPKFTNMILPDREISERAFSADEMDAIVAFLHEKQQREPTYFPAYALEMQIIMGLRRGEIPPLRTVDINAEKGFVEIRREMVVVKKGVNVAKEYAQIVDHTKTWKNRRYPLTDELKNFLQRLYAAREAHGVDSEYLFPADNEMGCITINTVYNFYRRMCKKLQIPVRRDVIRGPHAFRRNASTDVIEKSGGNIIMAAQLFGNSPEVLQKNYYTGLNMERARTILNS